MENLLTGNLALCLAELVVHLGPLCLSKLPVIVPDLLDVLTYLKTEPK